MFIHFEEFVRETADRAKYIEGFNSAVEHNLNVLLDKIEDLRRTGDQGGTDQADCFTRLFEGNCIYVLGRRGTGFEIDMPNDPVEFKNEINDYI
jgi:hypothetical protein